ncbi:MAG TPA: hypothetical protein VM070_02270 [Candidatus Saccharimonadales bacterium]|nr:hypothetical protein [Candidatus Saccharimonadales bacterium]
MTTLPRLDRAGLIVTATGVVSATAVSNALDERSSVAFSFGFLLYLALIAFTASRHAFRHANVVAFVAFALTYIGLDHVQDGLNAATLLYVAAAGLATAATPAAYRPLTVGAFALWTPAIRFFGPHPFDDAFPLSVTIAAILSLFTLVAILISRDTVTPEERVRRIGLGLLSVACVAAVADRHVSVASPGVLAPDDLLVVAGVGIFPLLAVVRLRPLLRDALATGLALAIYALVGAVLIIGQPYHVDTVVAQNRATELFLQGENPYRSVDVIASLRTFGLDPELGTHLEDGSQLHTLSYPALSFLIPAPFMALGVTDIRLVYLGEILLLVLILLRPIKIAWRPLVVAVVVGSAVISRQNLSAGVDPSYALLLALGFMFIRHRTISPILIGLAVASRQPAWFFVPFYVLAIWRRDGRGEALRRTGILASTAILPNLPFLLGAPDAFLRGVTAPMLIALEPYGVGLVSFGIGGVLPLWPRAVYGLLSAVALAGLLTLLWRRWRSFPNGAVVLPSLVLWFSWRSAQNYFGFAGVFALIGDETMLADEAPSQPD